MSLNIRTKKLRQPRTRKGDTIIEISFAIAVFSLVSLISISLMDSGLAMAEASLEYTMARNEIDAQAEALRFIQNSYYTEMEFVQGERVYEKLWEEITERAVGADDDTLSWFTYDFFDCDDAYGTDGLADHIYFSDGSSTYAFDNALKTHAFVIDTRNINPANVKQTVYSAWTNGQYRNFQSAQIHPRIVFNADQFNLTETNTNIQRVEGLWILAVTSNEEYDFDPPEYYDFHIRACWHSPGHSATPSSIATIVRLYNPNYLEEGDYE